jgi:hypothetical protein
VAGHRPATASVAWVRLTGNRRSARRS